MIAQPGAIREWSGVDTETFRNEIAPLHRPAVLRGVAADWPAVRAAQSSVGSISSYIKSFDGGATTEMLVGAPAIKGLFFYEEHMQGFNFVREANSITAALDRIIGEGAAPEPRAMFIQSAPVSQFLPDFARDNVMPLAGPGVGPRIWIGNSVAVTTHFDLSYNIAVCIAGRRRFTLFPPDQIANLYVGPMENTPAGTPVSMVSLEEPDFERYPRFADALNTAECAELVPGDAIYIPYCWWHHVRSLEPFNVLVNYWWNEAKPWLRAPYASLIHAVLGLRDLPPDQRAVWRAWFDYYVFQTDGEPLAHLAPEHRGSMAPLTQERVRHLVQVLIGALKS